MTLLKSTSIILLALFVSALLIFFSPKPPLLENGGFSTAVFDDEHHLLRLTLNKQDKFRLFTPLSQIPGKLIKATLLQEDRYFRHHYGINPLAMLHAAYQTYIVHKRRFGASTITMQLARLTFNIHSKTIYGKLIQIIRALQIERHYSKDQILEAYLNLAPYGGNVEGVGAASFIYFNKPVQKINLPEALTLAVIPQNPSKRVVNILALKDIRNQLFASWLRKYPQDADKKFTMTLPLAMHSPRELPFIAPHFVNALLSSNPSRTQEINTTLNSRLQKIMERISKNYMKRKHNLGVVNGALMLVDTRDMGIKALQGSADFFNNAIGGQINGTETLRSPGSTLKPFIYGLALDQGLIHPNTVLKDVPHSFGSYNPENFDYDFMGPVKARDALVLSRNIPALYLANLLGTENLYQLLVKARVSHLKSESYYGLTLSLGGIELSMQELISLYAMLQNEGIWQPLRMQKGVSSTFNARLLSTEASFLVLDMLKDREREGYISWKTGTSSGFRDAWTVGIFGPYALAVWIGNFDNTSNPAFVGKNIAAPLFFELIEGIKQEGVALPVIEKNPKSMNLVRIEVCKASGMLPTRYCEDTEPTWFIPGKSPIKTDTIFREVAINTKTGLRTCHFDNNTRFQVFEFWPTDLLKIFKQAGIERHTPPFYETDCALRSAQGLAPEISSPQARVNYIMHLNTASHHKIPLTAVTDAGVDVLYWFANNTFLGKSSPMLPFFWEAKPGKYIIRVVDSHGLSDARDVQVALE